MATEAPATTIANPPQDLEQIEHIDSTLVFPHFNTDTAWTLGSLLRTRLASIPQPVVIDIALAHSQHTLFRTTTHPGTTPDNDFWVTRKRNTVLRWGQSTWYQSCKYGGDEAAFGKKFSLGERVGEYAIHGGGWPVRVKGVEGIVAVVVVSGLKQDQDHGIIVQCVAEVLEAMGVDVGEKRKED